MQINDYDPIADLYDTYVPVTEDIEFFVNEAVKAGGEVLELMSGSGRVSIPLARAGVKLTCVDRSAGLNAILEARLHELGLSAEVIQMDVCKLELPRQFDMIIIPFNSFAHITSPMDQFDVLQRVRRHLAPGGTFICTLGNPYVREQEINGQLRLVREYPLPQTGGFLLFWTLEQSLKEDSQIIKALQFYEEYDAGGTLQSKRVIELRFRLTYLDEFERLATAAGYKLKAFYGDYSYGSFTGDSPNMIWVLQT